MNILFLDQKEPVEGKVVKQDDSHILIEGVEKNTSGFRLLTEKGCVFGKYEEFTTLYKEEESGFILELWLFGGEVDEQSVLHIGVSDYGGEENMMEMNIPINYCPRCGKKL